MAAALELYRARPAFVHARAAADGRQIEVIHRGGTRELVDLAAFAERYEAASPDDLLAAIASLRQGPHANGTPAPRRGRRTKAAEGTRGGVGRSRVTRGAATRNGDGRGPKWDVEQGLQLRKAGKTDVEIGAVVGASAGTVNAYGRAHGWPKRGALRQPTGTPKPRGRHRRRSGGGDTPARICVKCQQQTTHDPCEHCDAPWNGANGL